MVEMLVVLMDVTLVVVKVDGMVSKLVVQMAAW